MLSYKILTLSLVIVMATTILISSSFVSSAYAGRNNIKVGCKDVAITLITWDQLVKSVDAQDIVDIEHFLADEGVSQVLLKVLVDRHLDDLLDEVKDECNNLDDDIERVLDKFVDFPVP
jgi:hypothetical protein